MSKAAAVRLDKWLWAARFFKTRSLAAEAIKGGKVHVNGARIKPGKAAEIGQTLTINKYPQRFEIEILTISDKRQSFSVAQTLYQETIESITKREEEALLRKLAHQSAATIKGRPTKRNRRQIVQFTQKED